MSAKRQNLQFATKLETLHRVERGEKKSDVAAAFKIPRSTLSTILKNKAEVKTKADKRPGARDARRVRTPAYEEVEKAVYKWFLDVRSRNIPVSGPMIQQKAMDLAFLLDKPDFRGGSGWLQRFKERYDIVGKAVTGESSAVDVDGVNKWIEQNWSDITSRYHPRDIFNADETALFWQMLPNKTLARRDDKSHGGKVNKARISVLFTTNLDESMKLRPLVIGKSKLPICLRNALSVPVTHRSNGKAWMTTELFRKWLEAWNHDLVSQNHKVCLILDNCSAHHCGAKVSNIELRFLPPNTTSVLQPLDQGIIRAVKAGYRKRLVERLLQNIRVGRQLKIDLLGAVSMLSGAWNDVTKETIQNCFRHSGLSAPNEDVAAAASVERRDEVISGLDDLRGQLSEFPGAVPEGIELNDFVCADDDIETTGELMNADIIADFTNNEETSDGEEDSTEPIPTCSDALKALDVVRRYCATIESSGLSCSKSIDNTEKCVLTDAAEKKTQNTIHDYFAPQHA